MDNDEPCHFCGYPFDQDRLGLYGCANCHGEGLDDDFDDEQMKDTLLEVSVFPRVLYPANLKGDVNFRALGLTCYDPSNGQMPQEWLTENEDDE
jgi:hypothetical protein